MSDDDRPISNRLLGEAHHNEERYLIEILDRLKEEYIKAAQPYFARLAAIRERQNPPSIFVSVEHARELGLLPPNDGDHAHERSAAK